MTSLRTEVEARAADLRAQRVPFVHARVVLAERPTSAKPGDEAIVLGDGSVIGFVGGDCAESTVRAQALRLLDSGETLLLRISPSADDAGSTTSSSGMLTVHNPCLSGGTLEIFLAPEVPTPRVMVVGDSPVARALVVIGGALGYSVECTGDDADLPGDVAAVVVASHGRDDEAGALTRAVRAGVPYVGLVASRVRGAAVVDSLDVCGSMKARIVTPAGLDIGARTPEEIALSILADVVARRPRPTGRAISDPETAAGVAVDPVCGMSVAAVESSLHLDHDGTRWWFCGSGCLRAFAADPAPHRRVRAESTSPT